MRLVDATFDWLIRPRVRGVLRWSFVVTLPLCALLVTVRGLDAVLVIFAVELATFMLVLAAASRFGGERGRFILDLVMHPAVRRLMWTEAQIMVVLPRALLRSVHGGRRTATEYPYAKGDVELPLAIAFVPAFVAEATVVHLLVPDGLGWLKLAPLALSLYGLLWILGWAIGLRTFPHRLHADVLDLRLGSLYRACVPLDSIVSVSHERAKSGTRTRLDATGDAVALRVGGRVDLHVTLDRAIAVRRPLGEPLQVTSISFAADDAARLAGRMRALSPPTGTSARHDNGGAACMTLTGS